MIKTKSLIKQLNKTSKTLSLENKKIYDDILIYILSSYIHKKDAEEFLRQTLDNFLDAEQQGKNIETLLGTSDIEHYCEGIVDTYKSSYNYISLCGEYIMYTGIFIIILSFINYITQSLITSTTYGIDNFTYYLNFDLELVFEFLIIVPVVIIFIIYNKNSCFNETSKGDRIKEYFKLFIIWSFGSYLIIACLMFLDKTLLFQLNIIIVLIIGVALYFTGNYLSEK